MNLLFTMCARAGSKGIKNKNVRNFLDFPLSYYTVAAYQLFLDSYSKDFDTIHLCVNTDSEPLLNQLNLLSLRYTHVPRKSEFAGDTASKVSVIRDSFQYMQEKNNIDYDVVIDMDLTSPLRTKEDLKGIIDTLTSNPLAEISFSMTNSRRSPYFNMVDSKDGIFYSTVIQSDFTARQQVPPAFDMNASLYAYSNQFLSNNNMNKVFDGKAVGYYMEDTAVLDIDHENDFELLELLASYFYRKSEKHNEIYSYVKSI